MRVLPLRRRLGRRVLSRVESGVGDVRRVHSVAGRSMGLSKPCMRSSLLRSMNLSSKAMGMEVHVGRRCCCEVLDRVDKVRVRDRCRLVRAVRRLMRVGRRCMGIRTTLRTIHKANCNIIIPGLSRVRVTRPRIVQRKGGCKMGVGSGDPSVRVVGTGVRARVTPVMKARRRTGSLVRCVSRNDREKRDV